MRYPGILGSSVDPNKMALTFRGLLEMSVPLIILIFKSRNVEVDQNAIMSAGDAIVTTFLAVWAAVGACRSLFGAGRKVYMQFFNK